MGESYRASELRNPGAMAEGASQRKSRALGFGPGCAMTSPPWGLGFLAAKDKGWVMSLLPSPGAMTPKEAPVSMAPASSLLPDLSLAVLLPLSAEGAGVARPSPVGRTRQRRAAGASPLSALLMLPLSDASSPPGGTAGRKALGLAGPGGRHT